MAQERSPSGGDGEIVWPWGMTGRDPDPADRPWVFRPQGFVLLVLEDDDEVARATESLAGTGFRADHQRAYPGRQLLEDRERWVAQQSLARRVVENATIDQEAVDLLVDHARRGRAFLWVVTPTRDDANRAIRALADHRVQFVRYYGERSVEDLRFG